MRRISKISQLAKFVEILSLAICTIFVSGSVGNLAAAQDNLVKQLSPKISRVADLALPANSSFEFECSPVSDLAQIQIEALEDKTRGAEFCGGRSMVKNENVEIVLVTIEGACGDSLRLRQAGSCGNNYKRYMIGIQDNHVVQTIRVGGKFDYSVEKVDLQGSRVILSGKIHNKSDSSCCPTLEQTREYEIKNGYFVENF